MTPARRLVLVGAGHAHIEVLRRFALQPPSASELVLVIDRNPAIYSGMVPGFVAGQYRAAELEIDGAALARRAGARVLIDPVCAIDASAATLHTQSGHQLAYDWASLDLGASVFGSQLPGVAQHALASRPIDQLISGSDALLSRAREQRRAEPWRLLVVGAGAGGVELAFCFESRLRRELGRAAEVTLLDRSDSVMSAAPPALRCRVERALGRRGIRFRGGAEVCALDGSRVVLAERPGGGGEQGLLADAVVWVPGPAPHAFMADTDLPLDRSGYVRIRSTLQVEGHDRLFAVGDCASLAGMQKAGVYAVRAGPILAENLRRTLAGTSSDALLRYEPQREFLSLLNLGDGTAVGTKRGISFEGRWVMALKDRIDRRFMARYR